MKLITKEIDKAFDKQGYVGGKNAGEIFIICKFFNPIGASTWYLYEHDKQNPDWFMAYVNLGDPALSECGTVSLTEIEEFRSELLGFKIERDINFPIGKYTLKEVMAKVRSGIHV